jgi:hypothetical protein
LTRVCTTAHAGAALLHARINPFSIKNRQLSDAEMDERFAHYKIPTDLPLIGVPASEVRDTLRHPLIRTSEAKGH